MPTACDRNVKIAGNENTVKDSRYAVRGTCIHALWTDNIPNIFLAEPSCRTALVKRWMGRKNQGRLGAGLGIRREKGRRKEAR